MSNDVVAIKYFMAIVFSYDSGGIALESILSSV